MRWSNALLCSALWVTACAGTGASQDSEEPDFHGTELPPTADDEKADTSPADRTLPLSRYVNGSCSTEVVLGLSNQIAAEMSCMVPDSLRSFVPGSGVKFVSGAVLPVLAADAASDLRDVTADGTQIQVDSGLRTVAQQYLLYSWFQQGRCSISVAAHPGRSNHETGRALDLHDATPVVGKMAAAGWQHLDGDPPHFDHLASSDQRGLDVQAFQRLWNRNHPDDLIDEDGEFGSATEERLAKTPAQGFDQGACMEAPPAMQPTPNAPTPPADPPASTPPPTDPPATDPPATSPPTSAPSSDPASVTPWWYAHLR